jgi:hypothetical protein
MKRIIPLVTSIIILLSAATAIYAEDNSQVYKGTSGMPTLFIKIVNLMNGHGFSTYSYSSTNSSTNNSRTVTEIRNNSNINDNMSLLRLQLNRLLLEHSTLATTDMELIYDNKDNSRIRELLNSNNEDLANVLNNASQNTNSRITNGNLNFNRNTFITIWTQHINEYENYARALKSQNANDQQKAKNNLQSLSQQLANQFDSQGETPVAQDNDSDDVILVRMQDHVDGTINVLNSYANNDSRDYANNLKSGIDHSEAFADSIADIFNGAFSVSPTLSITVTPTLPPHP